MGLTTIWISLCLSESQNLSHTDFTESARSSDIIARHRESVRDHHFTEFIAGICFVFYVWLFQWDLFGFGLISFLQPWSYAILIADYEFLFGSYVRGIGWGEIIFYLLIWMVDFFENVSLLNQTRYFSIQLFLKVHFYYRFCWILFLRLWQKLYYFMSS